MDPSGRPSFQALQHRRAHPRHAIAFYAFDLLYLEGKDLTSRPLDERRARLAEVVRGSALLLSTPLEGSASRVVEAVRALGLEGVVAKRRSSRYVPGERSADWLKLKLDKQQEFVAGGYRPGPNGAMAGVSRLVIRVGRRLRNRLADWRRFRTGRRSMNVPCCG